MKTSLKRNITVFTFILLSLASFCYVNIDSILASTDITSDAKERTSVLIQETAQAAPTWFIETFVALFNHHAQ
jgi:hypothetical protein